MHHSNEMIQDDELHPGPFDGKMDHESERDAKLTIQDTHSGHQADEGEFEDFDMIDLDGNVLTSDPATVKASRKWSLQVGGLFVEKGADIKQVMPAMLELYREHKWELGPDNSNPDKLHTPMQKLLDLKKAPRGFNVTELLGGSTTRHLLDTATITPPVPIQDIARQLSWSSSLASRLTLEYIWVGSCLI